jgi:hypothetical protein
MFLPITMSKLVLEKELSLIRQRLKAIEEALGEEMSLNDKEALDQALKEHREGTSIPFKAARSRTRSG